MNWRVLTAISSLVCAVAVTAQPPPTAGPDIPAWLKKDSEWFTERGYTNPHSVNGHSGVFLRITSRNAKVLEGDLWFYRSNGNAHIRDANPVKVIAKSRGGSGRGLKAKLWVKGNEAENDHIGWLTAWDNSRRNVRKPTQPPPPPPVVRKNFQRRLALRIMKKPGSEGSIKKTKMNCDTPPDDDILEEEETPVPGDPDPQMEEYEDPYP